jgi:hypothetical protein
VRPAFARTRYFVLIGPDDGQPDDDASCAAGEYEDDGERPGGACIVFEALIGDGTAAGACASGSRSAAGFKEKV